MVTAIIIIIWIIRVGIRYIVQITYLKMQSIRNLFLLDTRREIETFFFGLKSN